MDLLEDTTTSLMNTSLFHRDPGFDYPVITRGEGIYLYDEAGKRYFDGVAGASNVTLGHGRRRIADAMAEQAASLAYCFSANFTNRPAIDYAGRLTALAPGDLNYAYFVSGGSEGIETALKMARQYHIQRGNHQKQLAIARWGSYHGATLGALGVTGMPGMRYPYAGLLPPYPHIDACYPYRCRFAGCGEGGGGGCNLSCARALERAILEAGPENVSAFVAEPVSMGSVAGSIPPAAYFPLIEQICERYDVLFIADEVITGFGRTGRLFAIEHWDVVPDMLVFGKGASSGYCPLGGVLLREGVRESFVDAGDFFRHIFTYVDNPLGMRVGSIVLDIIEEEGILQHVREVSAHLEAAARRLLEPHPTVGEVRCIGLIMGVEFVQDKKTKQPFPASVQFHKRLSAKLLDRGLSAGTSGGGADFTDGDDLRLYPPLIVTPAQIDEAITIINEGLTQLESELGV